MALAAPGAVWLSNHPLVDRWLSGTASDIVIAVAVFLLSMNLLAAGALVLSSGLGIARPFGDRRSRWAAALLMLAANLSVPVFVYSLVQDDAAITGLSDVWAALMAIGAIAFYVGIIRLFRRSQQYDALSADDAMRRDPRAPVIYLRAFTDDGQLVVPYAHWRQRLFSRAFGSLTLTSAEQELAFILHRIGPVIAIGKPGEALPELGAARMYVEHDVWQQTVLEKLDQSALALVRVGKSPGVLWELDQVMSRPRRKLLLMSLGAPDAVTAGLRAIEERLGERLDVIPPPSFRLQALLTLMSPDPHHVIGVLVGFDEAGRPQAHAIPAMAFGLNDLTRTVMMRPFAGPLRATSRKLFAWQGREWRDPPNRLIAVVLALVAGGFGLHWFYLGDRRRGLRRLYLLPVIYLTLLYAWFEACRWLLWDRRQFEESVAAERAGR